MSTGSSARPSAIERFLGIFSTVKPGEAGTALLLTANVFLLICAYSLLKVLREPLILAGGGAEVKSYSSAGQALLLLITVPAYSALASHFPRRKLINTVTGFFFVCLVAFFFLARLGAPVGIPFYIWLGIFNVMLIAQFWAFANDVYTNEEGKRLFPIVAFGQSAGAVLGAYSAGKAIETIGLYPVFLIASGLLVGGTLITNLVDARERRRTEAARSTLESTASSPAGTQEVRLDSGEFRRADLQAALAKKPETKPEVEKKPAPGGRSDGFALVFRSRYLLMIAFMILLLNWVNSTGEYILGKTVTRAAAEATAGFQGGAADEAKKVFIGKFYSLYQFGVNVAGLLIQLFVVSRLLKFVGVRFAILILPAIAVFGYGAVALVPLLAVIRNVKTAENATDYSLQNTLRQVLFLPTTREEKYKAKQAIDSFFVRMGDVLSAGLVLAGTTWLTFQTRHFAMVNVVLAVVWLVLAFRIGREYQRASAATAT